MDEKLKRLPRREFLKKCLYTGAGISLLNEGLFSGMIEAMGAPALHRADYWKPVGGGVVECKLCPNACQLAPEENGLCHARGNRGGILYSLVYGTPAVIALDYIEKTPLYHFQIKGKVFSIATAGCNLSCRFCQNYTVSQVGPEKAPKKFHLDPDDVVRRALKHGSRGINFFYTEPTIYYEYMLDIAKLAKKKGLKTTCITAGYIHTEPLLKLIPYIDAFAVGLKGFTEEFYSRYIGGDLETIKKTLVTLSQHKKETWFEIVNLIIPGINDKSKQIKAMSHWIVNTLGKDVPVHFTRFYPAYHMKSTPITPHRTLKQAHTIAKKAGINFVYLGNIPGEEAAHTFCPKCGKKVIERVNFLVIKNSLKHGRCSCGYTLPGRWR